MPVKGKHLIHYVPHGIDSEIFKPLESTDKTLVSFKKKFFGEKEYKFVMFYNSRNINRKRTSNIMLAYRTLCENLPKEEADKCILVLHTEKVLDAGTDLIAVGEAFLKDYNYLVIENQFTSEEMNLLYNIADVTINISSSEGFGLSVAESIMAGTPVIVNVTGGLQDQIGQLTNLGEPVEFDAQFGSNNVKRYINHGVWVKPIWPVTRLIQGSPQTPYIFDDLCTWEEAANAMMYWYKTSSADRELCGLAGRRWAMNEGGINKENLSKQFILAMDFTLENFSPEKKFTLHSDKEYVGNIQPDFGIGLEIPKIDQNDILEQVNKLKKSLE